MPQLSERNDVRHRGNVGAALRGRPEAGNFILMKFDPDIHHRRSIRLNNYDYSQPGAYFVTVCTHNRQSLFGHIRENSRFLNEAGNMIDRWWRELSNKYPMIETDAYTIMPNHFHGIVAIIAATAPCVCPDESGPDIAWAAPRGRPGQPHRVAPTLGDMIDWFKTMTTNDYIRGVKQCRWPPFPGKLWQRNFYEHIIRDEQDLNSIREYVINNPAGWDKDNENPERA